MTALVIIAAIVGYFLLVLLLAKVCAGATRYDHEISARCTAQPDGTPLSRQSDES